MEKKTHLENLSPQKSATGQQCVQMLKLETQCQGEQAQDMHTTLQHYFHNSTPFPGGRLQELGSVRNVPNPKSSRCPPDTRKMRTQQWQHLQKSPKRAAWEGLTPCRPICREAMSHPLVASLGASSGRPKPLAIHRHSLGRRELPIACANFSCTQVLEQHCIHALIEFSES